jgi:hypothetical protein
MPSGNLSPMFERTTNQQRASIVYQYRISGLSQDAFCEQLRARQGIQLAPRTLRAWSSRFGPPTNSTDACVQIVSQAIQRLQGILEALHAGDLETAPGTSETAAAPASGSEAKKELASASPTDAAGALPPGMPGGKPQSHIEFMPTEKPPTPENPRRRRGVIFDI